MGDVRGDGGAREAAGIDVYAPAPEQLAHLQGSEEDSAPPVPEGVFTLEAMRLVNELQQINCIAQVSGFDSVARHYGSPRGIPHTIDTR